MDTGPCRAHPEVVSVTSPADEMEALTYVFDRLSDRFPTASEERIWDAIASALVEFDGARLRGYVPVLVEGRAIRTLRAPDLRTAC